MDDLPSAEGTRAADNPYIRCTWTQLHDALIEKEYELQCMSDQLRKLSALEAEDQRKSAVVAELRKEVAAYRKNSWSKDLTYVSMEEHLASCESHLQERMAEVKSLQKQLNECREQLRDTESKRSSLQKQLQTKDSNRAAQKEEVQRLKQQHEAALATVDSVRQECRDKQRSIAALQEKVKKLKSENQDLHKRLEASQAAEDQLTAMDRRSKAQVSKTQGYIATMKQLQARCQFLEEEVAKTKERECDLAGKLGEKTEEMTSLCQQLLTLTSSRAVDHSSYLPEVVIQAVSPLVEQNAELQGQCQSLTKELEEVQDKLDTMCGDANNVAQCLDGFKESSEPVNVASVLEEALRRLEGIECESIVGSLKFSTRWSEIVQQLTLECKNLDDEGEQDPTRMVSAIAGVAHRKVAECQTLQQRLAEGELEHKAAMTGAMSAFKLDEESKVAQAVNHARKEEQNRFEHELNSIKQQMEAEREAAVSKQQEITRAKEEELEHSKKIISQLESMAAEKEQIEEQVAALETKVSELEESNNQALHLAEMQKETLRQKLQEEVSGYKEKSQQYALTIVALEEKLLPLVERGQALEKENGQLKEQLADQVDVAGAGETEGSTELQKLEQLASVLRHQLVLANQELGKREAEVLLLQNNLDSIEEDLQQREATLREQMSAEAADLGKSLAAQEEVVESQRQEITRLTQLLEARTSAQTQTPKGKDEEELTADLHAIESVPEQQETRGELLRAGERCIGERHGEIIDGQKEAITQLKHELADAMLARPPGPTHQVTLRELSKAREELLKSKAGPVKESTSMDSGGNEGSVGGKEPPISMDILHYSEQSYQVLVDALCTALSIEKPHGDSILSPEGNVAVWKQAFCNRQKFADKLSKILQNRSTPLTHTLVDQQWYRGDLRSGSSSSGDGSEAEGNHSGKAINVTDSAQKIAELEAKLADTAEELEQQRRLNHALLRRKTFKEVLSRETSAKPKHKCTTTSDY